MLKANLGTTESCNCAITSTSRKSKGKRTITFLRIGFIYIQYSRYFSVSDVHLTQMKLLIAFLILSGTCFGQIGTGQWRLHVPASRSIDVTLLNGKVYGAYENGVSEYDISSGETSLWTAVDGLSDISISCLGSSNTDNSIFIGYENGNIDKLKNNEITNIPAIVLANIQGSKRINRIIEKDGYIYLATGFAVVKIDPVKNEVRDTYYPTNGNSPIVDIAFKGDSIFALSPDRMYSGIASNPALADPTQWDLDIRVPVAVGDTLYADLEYVNGDLFLSRVSPEYALDSVYRVTNSGISNIVTETFPMEVVSLQNIDERLVINYRGISSIYNTNMTVHQIIYTYNNGYYPNANAIVQDGEVVYIADNDQGLMKLEGFYNGTRIPIVGPPGNNFYKLNWSNGKLAISKGSLTGKFHTYTIAGAYMFEDESWKKFDNKTFPLWDMQPTYDVIDVAINPVTDELALGSFSFTPLTIVDLETGAYDTITPVNGGLEYHTNASGETFISELEYDSEGNLWILNSFASSSPLKVLTSDGQWGSTNTGSSTLNKLAGELNIDYKGHKWFSISGVGLIGLNDGGTPTNPSDDKYVTLNIGESTGALPSNDVTAIAVDFDNEIWIGTDNGFAVLYNSENAFDAGTGEYNAQRIKLEFEGNVLGATEITDIEVDGGNRKWFGTTNAGIILLSADGQEIIEQHTIDNSPLISNTIVDMELDHNTGELFIITDKGLVSYRTDATYEDATYENVTVFPNPARPDFEGPITIQGIRYDSDVRITDSGGNLIYKTSSNGGTATWNCKTLSGDRVPTGVYLIWTAPNDPALKGRMVGKVLVVN